MKWTTQDPTKEGFYWSRLVTPEGATDPVVFRVVTNVSGGLVVHFRGLHSKGSLSFERMRNDIKLFRDGHTQQWSDEPIKCEVTE